jgi:hypothetical protein
LSYKHAAPTALQTATGSCKVEARVVSRNRF